MRRRAVPGGLMRTTRHRTYASASERPERALVDGREVRLCLWRRRIQRFHPLIRGGEVRPWRRRWRRREAEPGERRPVRLHRGRKLLLRRSKRRWERGRQAEEILDLRCVCRSVREPDRRQEQLGRVLVVELV